MLTSSKLKNRTISDKLEFFKKFGYEPHAKQLSVHQAMLSYRYIIVCAGSRGGKSCLAGGEIMDFFCQPNKRIWCVSSRYALAEKPIAWFLNFAGQYQIGEKRLIDYCHVSVPSKGGQSIIAPWGSFVKTLSTEKPQGLLGEELDLLVIDETSQVRQEPWDRMLSMRIASREGKVLAISTPNGDGGLFSEFFENGQTKQDKGWWSIQFSTSDNPTISKNELESARERMTDENYREQVLGEFVSRRGRVFGFDQSSHVVEELPTGWENFPVVTGIRPQMHNPYIVIFIAYDMELGIYYIFDEVYQENATASQIAPMVKQKSLGHHVRANVTDFWDTVGRDKLNTCGIETITNFEKRLNKNQGDAKRIQMLQNLLKVHNDGYTRIKIKSSCVRLIEDLKKCTWADSRAEQNRSEIEMPLDKHLGGPKALGFALAFIEGTLGHNVFGDNN